MLSALGRMGSNVPMRLKHLAFLPLMLVGIWVITCEGGERRNPEEWNVKLTGLSSRCSGYLEIFHGNKWKRICTNSKPWKLQNAEVVCKQLHCGSPFGVMNYYIQESKQQEYWMSRVDCQGNETALQDCNRKEFNCTHQMDVAMVCHDPVQTSTDSLPTPSVLETASEPTDTPSMRVDDGTSLCSGIEDQYFGVHTEMVCKGLQNWWHKLAPRICQGVNCDAAGELKSLGRKNQPNAGHWEKVLCEKRNLSLECLTHTKECLSITLVKCSDQDSKPSVDITLRILLSLVLTAVLLVFCVPTAYKKLVKKYCKTQHQEQPQWIGPSGTKHNVSFYRINSVAFQPRLEGQGVQEVEADYIQGFKRNSYLAAYPALEGTNCRSSGRLDENSDSDYDLCSVQQL